MRTPAWIDENHLLEITREVISIGIEGIKTDDRKFYKNSIDPFSALFDSAVNNINLTQWINLEKRRQAQKTLQNAVGLFHQKTLASISGCGIPAHDYIDLVSEERKIVAEIKNKHNTVTGSKLKDVYTELNESVNHKTSKYKGYTAYYVTIIPKSKRKVNKPFVPSDNSKGQKLKELENIRVIDGYSFYQLMTGSENALHDLYNALPFVVQEVLKELKIDFDAIKYREDEFFSTLFGKTF